MDEAEQLLRQILESGDMLGTDGTGRNLLCLALTDAELDRLLAFVADADEREDGGDDEPYEVPPVNACWLDAA